MAEVFLSYSNKDREAVSVLAAALEKAGATVWWDKRIDAAGAYYPKQIWDALLESKVTLVCWSDASLASEWVFGEAEEARKDKKLVQVLLSPCRVRPPFNALQTFDLSDWHGQPDHDGWRRTLQAVADFAGRVVRPPNNAAERAHEDVEAGKVVPRPPPRSGVPTVVTIRQAFQKFADRARHLPAWDKDKHSRVIMLLYGVTDGGGPFWAYAAILPSRFEAFKEAEARGEISIEHGFDTWGEVVIVAEGDYPPDRITVEVAEVYGAELSTFFNGKDPLQAIDETVSENMEYRISRIGKSIQDWFKKL